MRSREFAVGVADVRAGRGYRNGFDTWKGNDQWNYERGRMWAARAPRSVALKRDGKITREAMRWYNDDII